MTTIPAGQRPINQPTSTPKTSASTSSKSRLDAQHPKSSIKKIPNALDSSPKSRRRTSLHNPAFDASFDMASAATGLPSNNEQETGDATLAAKRDYNRFQFDLLPEDNEDSFSALTNMSTITASATTPRAVGLKTPKQSSTSSSGIPIPVANGSPSKDGGKGDEYGQMGLKQREKIVDDMKKENFNLKLKIYYLEEANQKMSPDGYNNLANENAQLNAEIDSLRTELDLYRKELESSLRRFEEQASAVDQVQGAYDAKAREVMVIRTELEAAQQALSQIDGNHNTVERDSEQLRAQIIELRNQIRLLQESRDRTLQDAESSHLEASLAKTQVQDLEKLRSENARLRQEVGKLKSDLEAHRVTIREFTALIDNLQSDVEAERAEKLKVRTELKTALAQVDQQKTSLAEMTSKMAERDSQITSLRTEGDKRWTEAEELRIQVSKLKDEHSKKQSLLKDASDMIREAQRQKETITREHAQAIESVRDEIVKTSDKHRDELETKIRNLTEQLNHSKQTNLNLNAQVELLRAKTTSESSTTQNARLEIESLKTQTSKLNEELFAARTSQSSIITQLQLATTENTHLKERLSSTSNKSSTELESLHTEISTLRSTIIRHNDEHRNDISRLNEEHARQVRNLEREREGLLESIKERSDKLTRAQEEIEKNKKQLSKVKIVLKEREKFKGEVDERGKEVERLQQVIGRQTQEILELKSKLEGQHRISQADIDALQMQLSSRTESLALAQAEVERVNNELVTILTKRPVQPKSTINDYALASEISVRSAENEHLRKKLAGLRETSAVEDEEQTLQDASATSFREQNYSLQAQLAELADRLFEKTEESNHLLAELDEKSVAHRQAVEQMSERWGREQAKLKADIAVLKEKRGQDMAENERLQSQVEEVQRLHDESELHSQELIQRVQHDLESKTRELTAAREEVNTLIQRLTNAEPQLSAKSAIVEDLNRKVEMQASHISRLESQNKALLAHEAELLMLRARLVSSEQEIATYRKQVAGTQEHLETFERLSSNAARDLQVLKEQLVEQTARIRDLESGMYGEAASRAENSERDIERIVREEQDLWRARLREQEARWQDINHKMEADVRKSKGQVESLENVIRERNNEISELRQQVNSLVEDVDSEIDKRIGVEDSLKRFQDYEEVKNENRELRGETQDLKASLLRLRDDVVSKSKLLEEALEERDSLHSNLKDSRREAEKAIKVVEQLRSQVRQLESAAESNLMSDHELQEKVAQLEEMVAERDHKLSEATSRLERLNKQSGILAEKMTSAQSAFEKAEERVLSLMRESEEKSLTIGTLQQLVEELRRSMSTQHELVATSRTHIAQHVAERDELLSKVLSQMNHVLPSHSQEEHMTPTSNFVGFAEALLTRVKAVCKTRQDCQMNLSQLEGRMRRQIQDWQSRFEARTSELAQYETQINRAFIKQRALIDARHDLRRELEDEQYARARLEARATALERELKIAESAARDAMRNQQQQQGQSRTTTPDPVRHNNSSNSNEQRRVRELENQLENAQEMLEMDRRAADSRVRELNEQMHALQVEMQALQQQQKGSRAASEGGMSSRSRMDVVGVSTSSLALDDQAKLYKMNENLRRDLDYQAKLADDTAEKLRAAKNQLVTTETECAKLKRSLHQRDVLIRQAVSKLDMMGDKKESVALLQSAAGQLSTFSLNDVLGSSSSSLLDARQRGPSKSPPRGFGGV
ncbi:hypothetical protein SmJEL517_g01069 [Synchytrium microbalum]|uniref:Centrosomin N-terminal motif 1 domain-containing protein n=1 Tax=Synchytrium microbalum TaxID=1806994 RepID=A0A507CCE8_9FUNG|nr:uncharacterized protein SmJEL517_g01069 [Synchytrium microbalum]TPX37018.1 hypothetical protein SmJEL517_g01069 [Synchytrium microbalum]